MRMLGKKGNVLDGLFAVLTFFGIVLIVIFAFMAQSMFNDEIQSVSDISADAKTPIQDYTNKMPESWDSAVILIFLAFHILIIILGVMTKSHPMLFPVLFLALIGILLLSVYLSNVFDEIAGEAELSGYFSQFPMSSFIIDNFLMVNLFTLFIDIIVFLALGALINPEGGDF